MLTKEKKKSEIETFNRIRLFHLISCIFLLGDQKTKQMKSNDQFVINNCKEKGARWPFYIQSPAFPHKLHNSLELFLLENVQTLTFRKCYSYYVVCYSWNSSSSSDKDNFLNLFIILSHLPGSFFYSKVLNFIKIFLDFLWFFYLMRKVNFFKKNMRQNRLCKNFKF